MAPAKKKQKAQRRGPSNGANGANGDRQGTALHETDIHLNLRNGSNTDAQPPVITNKTAIEDLMESANSRPKIATDTTDTHEHITHGKAEAKSEQKEDRLAPRDVSYCTICGGLLATKTIHEGIHLHFDRPYNEWKAKTPGLKPWMYKKMYLAVSLEHLQKDPKFTPENPNHLEFLQGQHENFSKYEDFRKLVAASSCNAVDNISKLPSNPEALDIMGKSRKRKRDSEAHHDHDMEKQDTSKEGIGPGEEVQDSELLHGPPYGAYPMHEACHAIANHYMLAANRKGDKLMTLNGVSNWVDLYRSLQAHWSPQQQKVTLLAHQYPHGYHGAAVFQGQDCWKRVEASRVFEALPMTDSSYTTAYLLSKLRPLPVPHNNAILGPRDGEGEKNVMTILPSHHQAIDFPWQSIPFHRGSLQWLLLQNTTLDLPSEIITFIRNELRGLHNPPLKRSRPTYLPEYWREVLLRGFPWLWDLDREQCRLKDSETYDDGSKIRWDWERLVRLLAQDDVFVSEGEGEGLRGAPEGLRNRRRIWRCLDEMR